MQSQKAKKKNNQQSSCASFFCARSQRNSKIISWYKIFFSEVNVVMHQTIYKKTFGGIFGLSCRSQRPFFRESPYTYTHDQPGGLLEFKLVKKRCMSFDTFQTQLIHHYEIGHRKKKTISSFRKFIIHSALSNEVNTLHIYKYVYGQNHFAKWPFHLLSHFFFMYHISLTNTLLAINPLRTARIFLFYYYYADDGHGMAVYDKVLALIINGKIVIAMAKYFRLLNWMCCTKANQWSSLIINLSMGEWVKIENITNKYISWPSDELWRDVSWEKDGNLI